MVQSSMISGALITLEIIMYCKIPINTNVIKKPIFLKYLFFNNVLNMAKGIEIKKEMHVRIIIFVDISYQPTIF